MHVGLWQPLGAVQVPVSIPAPDRTHLATNCGLLFNELIKSPQGVMEAVLTLLRLALDLDTGRWTHRSAAIILFVIRLVVRVEGFMIFLINYNTITREKTSVNGTGWDRCVMYSLHLYTCVYSPMRASRCLDAHERQWHGLAQLCAGPGGGGG